MPDTSVPIQVFLADDSPLIRDRVAAMLGTRGIKIVGHADTPQGSIDGILAAKTDVAILDVQLEGGTGLQVIRAVRKVRPQIAFVVFTINAGAAFKKRYLEEGAHSFLDKAVEFDQLVDAVERAYRDTHPAVH